MKLLALDTSSAQCSVALLIDGSLASRGVRTAREHAQLLLPQVDALLAEAGISLRALDGIAFGRGPGSFTGLRIAAAVTQGLAAGADLPVRPVSSLRALAAQAKAIAGNAVQSPGAALLACMDARMGEVYWGVFGPTLADAAEAVGPSTSIIVPPGHHVVAAAGLGLAAWPGIASTLQLAPSQLLGDAEPHAADVARLAAADLAQGAAWLDAAQAQPVYLRNRVVQAPKGAGQGGL